MENTKQSMLAISDGFEEEWRVHVDRKTYTLNENQIAVVKKATEEGLRSIIWFEAMAISVAHISSIERTYRGMQRSKRKNTYEEIKDSKGLISAYREVVES